MADAQSPGDVSRMAFEAALSQPASGTDAGQIGFDGAAGQYVTAVASRAQEIQGVQHTVTQLPGFPPATFHTAGVSYEIPFGIL